MKIRTILTLRFTCITAVILITVLSSIFYFSEQSRSKEFYRDLKREAITKANLFLENRVDAKTMQSIYLNNREFINEVEVAIYTPQGRLLYHDAIEIDIVKETPEMIQQIKTKGELEIQQSKYEAIGLLYKFKEQDYILTAAAYDGYGYAKQDSLKLILIFSALIGLALFSLMGYFFAKKTLAPVSEIVNEAERITASNLDLRLPIRNSKDELGELAMTFNKMLDRLEKAFDSQHQFVSNVSHELRTPIAALSAELEIALLKERSNKEYIKAITNALSDTQRIAKLAKGLLDLAKASYQPEQISMQDIRIDEVLLDARNLVLKANPQYKIELIFEDIPANEDFITIKGNNYLLQTAFINLIENNCKFSRNNTSKILISYCDSMSIVQLEDTGVGIPAQDLDKLHIPFYRGDNKTLAKGHGIGMTLSYQIIMLHSGKLKTDSIKGIGTTYIVKIPHL